MDIKMIGDLINQYDIIQRIGVSYKEKTYCFCGTTYTDKKCPNCGANKPLKMKTNETLLKTKSFKKEVTETSLYIVEQSLSVLVEKDELSVRFNKERDIRIADGKFFCFMKQGVSANFDKFVKDSIKEFLPEI